MSPTEWARRFNALTPEEIARVMESLDTETLEFAVRFEGLEHRENGEEA